MPLVPALGKLRKTDHYIFEASLGYKVRAYFKINNEIINKNQFTGFG